MVKKTLAYGLLTLLVVGVLALAAAGNWLLRTSAGARWALAAASRWTPVALSAEELSGTLGGELELRGVRVRWAGGAAASDLLALRWQPAALLRGHLGIDRLALGNTVVRWEPAPAGDSPGEPFRLSWPRLEGALTGVSAEIARFAVTRLELGAAADEPFVLREIAAHLAWRNGVATVTELQLAAPFGRVTGTASASLVEPRLAADVRLAIAERVAGVDRLSLVAELAPGEDLCAGPLRVVAGAGENDRVRLRAFARVNPSGLELSELAAERDGAPDRVGGTASLDWSDPVPRAAADLRLTRVNLGPELDWPTAISGTLVASSDFVRYRGRGELTNDLSAWEKLAIKTDFSGDGEEILLSGVKADYLDGEVTGTIRLDWRAGFRCEADLQGRALDPSVIAGAPAGRLNLDLDGWVAVPPDAPWGLQVEGTFGDSTLLGRSFRGPFAGGWHQDDLVIDALALRGPELQLNARGRLRQRLDFSARVERLSTLAPEFSGQASASGWFARHAQGWAGDVEGSGSDLVWQDVTVDRWQLRARRPQAPGEARLFARLTGVARGQLALVSATVAGRGRVADHRLSLAADWGTGTSAAELAGGWRVDRWEGMLTSFRDEDERLGVWTSKGPARLVLGPERVRAADLVLTGSLGGDLRIDADVGLSPLSGDLEGSWRNLALAHVNPFLEGLTLAGQSAGDVQVKILSPRRLDLFAELQVAGSARSDDRTVKLEEGVADIVWTEKGLEARGYLRAFEGGRLDWRLSSDEPGRPALPEKGRIAADWGGLRLSRLQRWLPFAGEVRGEWTGQVSGGWSRGLVLDLTGESTVRDGSVVWREEEGELSFPIARALLDGRWRGQSLSGSLALEFEDYGYIRGSYQLPLPARLPTALQMDGPLRADIDLKARERGLLQAFFPGAVDETHGELLVDLQVQGSLRQPDFQGDFRLAGAGATLPAVGVVLKDLSVAGQFARQRITLSRFSVRSDPGTLTGSGVVELDRWRLASFEGQLSGQDFRLVHLPEVQIMVSPELKLRGRPGFLAVSGEVKVPEFLVYGWQNRTPVSRSSDVVVLGAEPSARRGPPFDLDLDLKLVLGSSVVVKLRGVDARLAGELRLATDPRDNIVGQGEIRVPQGYYSAYGIKLPITRGRLVFPGGPVEQPHLDILAQKTIGEVKAGVRVTGTPQEPVVKLTSDPAMPDTDVLAYLVLGRPLGTGAGQTDALMLAAGALLSQGESAALQDKLQRRLGIDVLEVDAGGGEVEGSMVTIGKYLTPDLYVSFGQSLFTETNVARLRYSLGENWGLESQVGTVSGVDLYYKIEFK